MTENEVITELNSQIKPYIGIMHQGTYSNYMTRYKFGILKPSTLCKFLNQMGYFKENGLWIKNKVD